MAILHGYCRHFGGHDWASRRCHIKKGKGKENKCYSRQSGCPDAEIWIPRCMNELKNVQRPSEKKPERLYILGPYEGPPESFKGEIRYRYWSGRPDPKGGVFLCEKCYAAHPALLGMGLIDEEWILDTPVSMAGIAITTLFRTVSIVLCLFLSIALVTDLVNEDISKARRISSRRGRRDEIFSAA
ncbi:MAG: hypothetical protein HQL72_02195 [Magnetococcales bacterium]|nr:hypothetical protein [Magnetococcales bacterium]